jgi:hypothetical protein
MQGDYNTIPSYFSKINFNITPCLCLLFSFFLVFPICTPLFPMRAKWHTHLILELIILITRTFSEVYKSLSSSLCNNL